ALPGLGQLGTLVAIGVALAAVVMLFAYLPPLLRKRRTPVSAATAAEARSAPHAAGLPIMQEPRLAAAALRPPGAVCASLGIFRGAWACTWLLVAAGAVLLEAKPPRLDYSPDALKPKNSQAYAALDELKSRLNRPQEPLWLVIEGRDEADVRRRLNG